MNHRRLLPTLFALSATFGGFATVNAEDNFVGGKDPFDIVQFQSGWKQVKKMGANGIASDGDKTVVAWGVAGYAVSRDAGFSWSRPLVMKTLNGGAVADGICLRGKVYVRDAAGVVFDASGTRLPLPPVSFIAATSEAIAAESGTEVIMIHGTTPRGRAPGRLLGVVAAGAVVYSDETRQAVLLTNAGQASPLSLNGAGAANLRSPAPSAAPATGSTYRDEGGAGWRVDGSSLTLTGMVQGLTITGMAGCDIRVGGTHMVAIGIAEDAASKTGHAIVGQDDRGSLRKISEEVPEGATMIAPVQVQDGARWRAVTASQTKGILMYRSDL